MGMQKNMYKSNPFFLRTPQSMYIYKYNPFFRKFQFLVKTSQKVYSWKYFSYLKRNVLVFLLLKLFPKKSGQHPWKRQFMTVCWVGWIESNSASHSQPLFPHLRETLFAKLASVDLFQMFSAYLNFVVTSYFPPQLKHL